MLSPASNQLENSIHIFGKHPENAILGLQVRALNEETQDLEDGNPEEPPVEEKTDVDTESTKLAANAKLNEILDDEAVALSLTYVGSDLKQIFESPIAEQTIREVAARIITIMTSEESLRNVQAVQAQIKFILLNKNAPQNVKNKVDGFVQFVTEPQNLPKVQEKCQHMIELIQFLGPGMTNMQDTKAMIEARLQEKNAKQRIDSLWHSVHLLAKVDPTKTMRGIMAKAPGMAFGKLGLGGVFRS